MIYQLYYMRYKCCASCLLNRSMCRCNIHSSSNRKYNDMKLKKNAIIFEQNIQWNIIVDVSYTIETSRRKKKYKQYNL